MYDNMHDAVRVSPDSPNEFGFDLSYYYCHCVSRTAGNCTSLLSRESEQRRGGRTSSFGWMIVDRVKGRRVRSPRYSAQGAEGGMNAAEEVGVNELWYRRFMAPRDRMTHYALLQSQRQGTSRYHRRTRSIL